MGSDSVSEKVPLIDREFRRFRPCTRLASQIARRGRFSGRSAGADKRDSTGRDRLRMGQPSDGGQGDFFNGRYLQRPAIPMR